MYEDFDNLDTGYDEQYEPEYDDSQDGDHASGLASAGMGTDEDYGLFNDSWYEEQWDLGDLY